MNAMHSVIPLEDSCSGFTEINGAHDSPLVRT